MKDSVAVRMFVKEGHNIALAQSYAKNMGLYGNLLFVKTNKISMISLMFSFFYRRKNWCLYIN